MQRFSGFVRAYDVGKGFGFIRSPGFPDDVFFHVSDVESAGTDVRVGASTEFSVEPTYRGPRARRVRVHAHGHAAVHGTDGKINRIRFTAGALRPEQPLDIGTEMLAPQLHGQLAAYLNFGDRAGSPAALRNSLARDEALRAAVHDLYVATKGGQPTGASYRLVASLAEILRDHAATEEPRVTNYLRVIARDLAPLFRLAQPAEKRETHLATEQVLARLVRHALTGVRASTPASDASFFSPAAAPVPATVAVQPVRRSEARPPTESSPAPRCGPPADAGSPTRASTTAGTVGVPAAPGGQTGAGLAGRVAACRMEMIRVATRPVLEARAVLQDAVEVACARPLDMHALDEARSKLNALAATMSAVMSALEPLADASGDRSASLQDVLDAIEQLVGSHACSDDLARALAVPGAAREVRGLAESWAALRDAPLPAWARDALLLCPGADIARALDDLRDPATSNRLRDCLGWIGGLSSPAQGLLRNLPQPARTPEPVDILEQLKRLLAAAVEAQRNDAALTARITAIADLLDPAFLDRISGAADREDLDRFEVLEGLAQRVRDQQENLSAAAFSELVGILRSGGDEQAVAERLAEVDAAVDAIGGDVSRFIPSLEALIASGKRRATSTPDPVAPPVSFTGSSAQGISIEHPLSKGTGGIYSADVAWSEQRGQGFGVVVFPVRLKAARPPERSGLCTIRADSEFLLGANPAEWRKHFPSTIQVPWPARAPRIDVAFALPVRKQRAQEIASGNRNFAVQFTVSAAGTEYIGKLEWQGLALEIPPYMSPFAQSISAREMEDRPLGVEWHFKRLVPVVEQGRKSFRVHGPRRFGKTTLVKALAERFRKSRSVAVLDRVVASDKPSPREVWAEVVSKLQKRFEIPISLTLTEQGLPSPGTFDGVRRKAREAGFGAIYVVIDEAQALFANRQDPGKFGTALKGMLEEEWGSVNDEHAALLLGLVGQAHLPSLMGADLLGAIADEYSASTIEEEELVVLLRSTGGTGLQSTAEARQALARQAGNFWILDRLLRRIADSCAEQGRAWFMEPDVDRAVERLVQDDRDGLDQNLWSYVRDVLNESDDRNQWIPGDAFPVAIAWAFMRSLGATGEPLDEIMDALEDWARTEEITVQRSVVAAVLQSLRDQKIIRKDNSFELPLLEALLTARANDGPFRERLERRSLVRLGLKRVTIPEGEGAGTSVSGGQASVERLRVAGRDLAVRRVRLADQLAEQRFAREVSLLQKISDAPGEQAGAARQHLPWVKDAGLDPKNTSTGIVIYEWVDGEPLRAGALAAEDALKILAGLAEALCLLKNLPPSGIVHRDIRPDNVIVRRRDGEPVLVDFGLSIAVEDVSRTSTLSGSFDFIPPEVRMKGSSHWSAAGDVFALGETLKRCLGEQRLRAERDIEKLLARMTGDRPEERPSPEEILDAANELLLARRIHDHDERLTAAFDAVVRKLPANAQDAIKAQRHDFVAAAKGTVRDRVKLFHGAEFLENLTQAYVLAKHPDVARRVREDGKSTLLLQFASMGASLPEPLQGLAVPASRAVGLLRNAAAHGAESDRIYQEACKVVTTDGRTTAGAPQLRDAALTVARAVGTLFAVPELTRLVGDWIRA